MIMWWILAGIVVLFGFVVFRGAPYVPSHHAEVRRAFDSLYPLNEHDLVVDAGSGDGIILRLASERGARATGYELNPALVLISRALSYRDSRVQIALRDFWLTSLPSDVTLVYGFCVTRDMPKMTRKLQSEADRLQKSIYFISYGNPINDRVAVRELGAHHLYMFAPLQEVKA